MRALIVIVNSGSVCTCYVCVCIRAVTFYLKFEYSFESGGKSSHLNVKTCSKSKCIVYKRNRPYEVICLVIQQRAL